MTTFIANAALIENKKIMSPAVITVESGVIEKITSVVPTSHRNAPLDLGDLFLFPGLVNAHCHLELTGIGPLAEHKFVPWIKKLVSFKKELTSQQITRAVHSGIQKLLSSGVTTILDHMSFDTPIAAYDNSPVRIMAFGEVLGIHKNASQKIFTAQKQNKKSAAIPFQISPHAVHTVNEMTLHEIFQDEPNPFSLHLCESEEESEYFKTKSGEMAELILAIAGSTALTQHHATSAMQWLKHQNCALKNSLIVHANKCDDADRDVLALWKNICIVHCPGSYEFFKHEDFEFEKLRTKKIPIALGTDSFASNTELSMLHEIKLFLTRYPQLTIEELMPMITTNACQAVGLDHVGEIHEGFSADMIGFKSATNKNALSFFKERAEIDWVLSRGQLVTQSLL